MCLYMYVTCQFSGLLLCWNSGFFLANIILHTISEYKTLQQSMRFTIQICRMAWNYMPCDKAKSFCFHHLLTVRCANRNSNLWISFDLDKLHRCFKRYVWGWYRYYIQKAGHNFASYIHCTEYWFVTNHFELIRIDRTTNSQTHMQANERSK